MKKLPVAGPTYDYKLENIRNDIIEQELALCLKKRENVYLDEDVQVKYTAADGTEYTFGQVTEDTVSLQTDVTTLQSDFTTLDGEVTANATAVSGLETRVTSAEGNISSNATSITSLQADLTSAESDIAANSSAVTTLTSSVSTLDGEVSALSSNVTSLTTTVGSNTTNITTNASSINGIEGKYAVKINNNGHVSGFGLISTANNATPTSTFTVTADAFKIVDTSGAATPAAPFEVYTTSRTVDGVTVPAGVYMENANITSAQIKTLDADVITTGTLNADRLSIDGVTIDTDGSGNLIVGNNSIGNNQISEINADKITAGTIDADVLTGAGITRIATDRTSSDQTNNLGSWQGYYSGLSANTSTTGVLSCSLSNVTAGSIIYAIFTGETLKNGTQVVSAIVELNMTGATSIESFGRNTESSLNSNALSKHSMVLVDTSASAGTVTASIDMRASGSGGSHLIRGVLMLFEGLT